MSILSCIRRRRSSSSDSSDSSQYSGSNSSRTVQSPRIQNIRPLATRQELQQASIPALIRKFKSEHNHNYPLRDLKYLDNDKLKALYQTCSNHRDEIQNRNNPTPQDRLDCQPYQAIIYHIETETLRRERYLSEDKLRNWLMENRQSNVAEQASLNPHAEPFIPASQRG